MTGLQAEQTLISESPICEEKDIIVIIPSFNNRQWYKKNLRSVLRQKYENFRVIYIDDCSTDGTYELVKKYIMQSRQEHRVELVKNKERKGALANLYQTIHRCPSNAIIVTVDGDDWLKHNHVLATVNRAYADSNIWMTYGQLEIYPTGATGFSQEIPQGVIELNAYREYLWITSHLRTFYAWLFQHIKLADLIYNGTFFQTTWDQAFMFPMLEMCAGRWKFISDVLYVYNEGNPLNDFKINVISQIHNNKVICSRPKYERLESPVDLCEESWARCTADAVIFSENNPACLRVLLESMQTYMHNLGFVHVLYQACDADIQKAYEQINQQFSEVVLVRYFAQKDDSDFASLLHSVISQGTSEYLFFAHDDLIVCNNVHIGNCVMALEKARAHGFYLALGHDSIDHSNLDS